jgi:hypothetical protein
LLAARPSGRVRTRRAAAALRRRYPDAELAVETLRWSRDERVGPFLRGGPSAASHRSGVTNGPSRCRRRVRRCRRTCRIGRCCGRCAGMRRRRRRRFWCWRRATGAPTCRAAALSSLGWWDRAARRGAAVPARRATRSQPGSATGGARPWPGSASGRRQWFRQTLIGEDAQRVHEGIQSIASEG